MHYLENVPKKYADHIWMFLVFLGWLISNYIDLIGDTKLAERVYFLLNSISVLLVSYFYLSDNWLKWSIVEISIYWVIDEIRNKGDIYDWYELPLMLCIFLTNYLYYKYKKQW